MNRMPKITANRAANYLLKCIAYFHVMAVQFLNRDSNTEFVNRGSYSKYGISTLGYLQTAVFVMR